MSVNQNRIPFSELQPNTVLNERTANNTPNTHESQETNQDFNENQAKKRKNFSNVNEYTQSFTRENVKSYKCNFCQKEMKASSGTTNVEKHLMKYHSDQLKSDFQDKKKQKKYSAEDILNRTLVLFLITAAIPLRVVENEYFQKFCELLNPNYRLPSRIKISDEYIPLLYEETAEKVF